MAPAAVVDLEKLIGEVLSGLDGPWHSRQKMSVRIQLSRDPEWTTPREDNLIWPRDAWLPYGHVDQTPFSVTFHPLYSLREAPVHQIVP